MNPTLLAELVAADPERHLALLWAPAPLRPALLAVLALDTRLERLVAGARDPLAAELRLAWWRERLLDLAAEKPPPPEPLLEALAAAPLDPADLARLDDGLLPLLGEEPPDLEALAAGRGRPLGRALAAAAGAPGHPHAETAGTLIADARLARANWGRAAARLAAARKARGAAPPPAPLPPLPPALRPLVALAHADLVRLAAGRPLARAASPSRQLRLAAAALFP